jgi:RNA 2',3'-cyclic 3'-phosphodiesterase
VVQIQNGLTSFFGFIILVGMSDSIRAFIAIDIDSRNRASLASLISRLQKSFQSNSVKWVPQQNLHLTLKFLGDVETWDLESLHQLIRNSSNQSRPFSLTFTRLGAFPSTGNPRVIWVGLQAPPDLLQLARVIEEGARKQGFEAEEKPFTPHLTIGRVRSGITRDQQANLASLLMQISMPPFSPFMIDSITLFQSNLKSGGAEYIPLFTSRFNH